MEGVRAISFVMPQNTRALSSRAMSRSSPHSGFMVTVLEASDSVQTFATRVTRATRRCAFVDAAE